MQVPNIRVLFIRHGESIVNQDSSRIAGQSPKSNLSEIGKKQCIYLGKRLKKENVKPFAVFSSPFIRAKKTAEIVLKESNLNLDIEIIEDLKEFSAGDWEGELRSQVYTDKQLRLMNTLGYIFTPPNGESQRMVERRISNWFEDQILYNPKFLQDDKEKLILIFSHGITIKCMLHYILGFSDRFIYRFELANTVICEFKFTQEGWYPISINDHSHLKNL